MKKIPKLKVIKKSNEILLEKFIVWQYLLILQYKIDNLLQEKFIQFLKKKIFLIFCFSLFNIFFFKKLFRITNGLSQNNLCFLFNFQAFGYLFSFNHANFNRC